MFIHIIPFSEISKLCYIKYFNVGCRQSMACIPGLEVHPTISQVVTGHVMNLSGNPYFSVYDDSSLTFASVNRVV